MNGTPLKKYWPSEARAASEWTSFIQVVDARYAAQLKQDISQLETDNVALVKVLHELVEQIEKCNPIDDHGHDFKMNRAFTNGRDYVSAHKL